MRVPASQPRCSEERRGPPYTLGRGASRETNLPTLGPPRTARGHVCVRPPHKATCRLMPACDRRAPRIMAQKQRQDRCQSRLWKSSDPKDVLAPSLGPPLSSSFPFQNSCLGLFFDSEGQDAVGGQGEGPMGVRFHLQTGWPAEPASWGLREGEPTPQGCREAGEAPPVAQQDGSPRSEDELRYSTRGGGRRRRGRAPLRPLFRQHQRHRGGEKMRNKDAHTV